jgi:NAD(P)H-nitrite reductase large subunit
LLYLPPNVKQVPGIKSACSEGFTFQDGSTAKADALIYCTGWLPNTEVGRKKHILNEWEEKFIVGRREYFR